MGGSRFTGRPDSTVPAQPMQGAFVRIERRNALFVGQGERVAHPAVGRNDLIAGGQRFLEFRG